MQFFRISILLLAIWAPVTGAVRDLLPAQDQRVISTGALLFHNLSCYGCHSQNGQGGKAGPDLDGVASRLSRQEMEVQLTTPRQRRSDSHMPSFAFLRSDEFQNLMDFLQTLK